MSYGEDPDLHGQLHGQFMEECSEAMFKKMTGWKIHHFQKRRYIDSTGVFSIVIH